MLTFNPLDFSYCPDNKDLECTTAIPEDPFTDFFDQYISQESPSSSDNVTEPIDLRAFDFGLKDDAASSSSRLADPPIARFASPRRRLLQRSSQVSPVTRSTDSLVARRCDKSCRIAKPTAAISSIELLNLEGKLPYQAAGGHHSSSTSSVSTLPLRRKPKFTPETLQGQNHRVSKPVTAGSNDPHNTMRPSYHYRHETPSYQEWTQRFGQINIQTATENLPLSPPPSASIPSCGPFSASQRPQHHQRHDSFNQPQLSPLKAARLQQGIPSPLASPVNFDPHARGLQFPQPQDPQSPSWPSSASKEDDYNSLTICPREVQPDWSSQDVLHQTSSSFYEQGSSAAHSAPALSHAESDFSTHGLPTAVHTFGEFITEDPSVDYVAPSIDPFQLASTEMFSFPAVEAPTEEQRCRTPSSRASSVCPLSSPPPLSVKSPSKPTTRRRRSKSSRRKPSAGTLKSPKSAGALGFVNFTPSDSQKILTGVAPSGSSKTKARRELEAHERKRKLSLAAEKAVRDAGGDPEKLRAAGLI